MNPTIYSKINEIAKKTGFEIEATLDGQRTYWALAEVFAISDGTDGTVIMIDTDWHQGPGHTVHHHTNTPIEVEIEGHIWQFPEKQFELRIVMKDVTDSFHVWQKWRKYADENNLGREAAKQWAFDSDALSPIARRLLKTEI